MLAFPMLNIIMTIETKKLSDLKPAPYNPRTSTKKQEQKLQESLTKFGVVEPIIFNKQTGYIVGGHFRVRELKKLGYKEVECVIVDLNEADEKELNIRLNANTGEWDWDTLANGWRVEDLTEWGLDIPSFETEEVLEAKEDDFDVPEGGIKTDIVLGDLFEIGEHKLLCGSSTEIDSWSKLMGSELCDMVMTDPPYNVDYKGGNGLTIMNDKMENNTFYQSLYDFYTALGSYTKKGGAWYVWHADSEGVNFRTAFEDSGLMLKQCLIWVKNALVMGRQDYQWKHEPCLYGWKPGGTHYFVDERNHTTVIEDKIDFKKLNKKQLLNILIESNCEKKSTSVIHCDKPSRNDVHPTIKPILLLAPLIKNSSKENELVADGFLGSGSTMVASHQLKRKCYGMELDPKYCKVIVDRMRKLDPSLVIKKNGELWQA